MTSSTGPACAAPRSGRWATTVRAPSSGQPSPTSSSPIGRRRSWASRRSPRRVRDEGFRVRWPAWDASPIRDYDVQLSVDGGPFVPWLTDTELTNSMILAKQGRTYAFRVRGTDVHGNTSAWKSTPLGVPRRPRLPPGRRVRHGPHRRAEAAVVGVDRRLDHDHARRRDRTPADRRAGAARGIHLVPGLGSHAPVGPHRPGPGRRLGRRVRQRRDARRPAPPDLRDPRRRRDDGASARRRRRANRVARRRRAGGHAPDVVDEPAVLRRDPAPPVPAGRLPRRDAGAARRQGGPRRDQVGVERPDRRRPRSGRRVRRAAPGAAGTGSSTTRRRRAC